MVSFRMQQAIELKQMKQKLNELSRKLDQLQARESEKFQCVYDKLDMEEFEKNDFNSPLLEDDFQVPLIDLNTPSIFDKDPSDVGDTIYDESSKDVSYTPLYENFEVPLVD